MKRILTIIIITLYYSINALAQSESRSLALQKSDKKGVEYELKTGVNIGGAGPLSLPPEIRKISQFSPKLNGIIEGAITKWFADKSFGVSCGVRVEEKGMITTAKVKNYAMSMKSDETTISGYYTGTVHTDYNSVMITMPLSLNYRYSPTIKLRTGIYLSYCLENSFVGWINDGYLRDGTPIGTKIEFKDGDIEYYDFSNDLRKFLGGLDIGFSWYAYNHFSLTADFTWGLNRIFQKDFNAISFDIYPIYLNFGFGYRF